MPLDRALFQIVRGHAPLYWPFCTPSEASTRSTLFSVGPVLRAGAARRSSSPLYSTVAIVAELRLGFGGRHTRTSTRINWLEECSYVRAGEGG